MEEFNGGRLLFMCIAGSHAHGTATATSDVDQRGVYAASKVDRLSPLGSPQQVEGPGDRVVFEFSKFLRLLIQQNPSILEIAWSPEHCIEHETPIWGLVRKHRGDLLCKKVRHTYSGYALDQIKRMKGHKRWLNRPQPEAPPRPTDFVSLVHDLTPQRDFLHAERLPRAGYTAVSLGNDLMLLYQTGDDRGWEDASGAFRKYRRDQAKPLIAGKPEAAIIQFNRSEYLSAKRDWDGYWTWKRNRNAARAEIEAHLGYDAKHAAHLIRLLRAGRDLLLTGELKVDRDDAEDLLAIRRGAYSYDEIIEMADEHEAEIDAAEKRSPLPEEVSTDLATRMSVELYEQCWYDPAATLAFSDVPRGRIVRP